VFSLTRQLVQLGYWPRTRVIHTSAEERGQVYVPGFNWAVMVATLALVLGFRTSGALAAAFGLAVAGTMLFTTNPVHGRRHRRWRWRWPALALFLAVFATTDPRLPDRERIQDRGRRLGASSRSARPVRADERCAVTDASGCAGSSRRARSRLDQFLESFGSIHRSACAAPRYS
jgi:hypothetical protein